MVWLYLIALCVSDSDFYYIRWQFFFLTKALLVLLCNFLIKMKRSRTTSGPSQSLPPKTPDVDVFPLLEQSCSYYRQIFDRPRDLKISPEDFNAILKVNVASWLLSIQSIHSAFKVSLKAKQRAFQQTELDTFIKLWYFYVLLNPPAINPRLMPCTPQSGIDALAADVSSKKGRDQYPTAVLEVIHKHVNFILGDLLQLKSLDHFLLVQYYLAIYYFEYLGAKDDKILIAIDSINERLQLLLSILQAEPNLSNEQSKLALQWYILFIELALNQRLKLYATTNVNGKLSITWFMRHLDAIDRAVASRYMLLLRLRIFSEFGASLGDMEAMLSSGMEVEEPSMSDVDFRDIGLILLARKACSLGDHAKLSLYIEDFSDEVTDESKDQTFGDRLPTEQLVDLSCKSMYPKRYYDALIGQLEPLKSYYRCLHGRFTLQDNADKFKTFEKAFLKYRLTNNHHAIVVVSLEKLYLVERFYHLLARGSSKSLLSECLDEMQAIQDCSDDRPFNQLLQYFSYVVHGKKELLEGLPEMVKVCEEILCELRVEKGLEIDELYSLCRRLEILLSNATALTLDLLNGMLFTALVHTVATLRLSNATHDMYVSPTKLSTRINLLDFHTAKSTCRKILSLLDDGLPGGFLVDSGSQLAGNSSSQLVGNSSQVSAAGYVNHLASSDVAINELYYSLTVTLLFSLLSSSPSSLESLEVFWSKARDVIPVKLASYFQPYVNDFHVE